VTSRKWEFILEKTPDYVHNGKIAFEKLDRLRNSPQGFGVSDLHCPAFDNRLKLPRRIYYWDFISLRMYPVNTTFYDAGSDRLDIRSPHVRTLKLKPPRRSSRNSPLLWLPFLIKKVRHLFMRPFSPQDASKQWTIKDQRLLIDIFS
jgi:hypothetical protein